MRENFYCHECREQNIYTELKIKEVIRFLETIDGITQFVDQYFFKECSARSGHGFKSGT